MKPEAQHIAFMTALGYENVMRVNLTRGGTALRGQFKGYEVTVPDLTLDLCAQAEATIPATMNPGQYLDALVLVVARSLGSTHTDPKKALAYTEVFPIVSATKEQRREAFLRVKGLWRDES